MNHLLDVNQGRTPAGRSDLPSLLWIRKGALLAALVLCGAAQAQNLVTLPNSAMPIVQNSTTVGTPSGSQVLHIAVSLKPKNSAAFEAFCNSVSDPKSPMYGHWLTPAQVGEQFGATTSTRDGVVNYLKSKGMTVAPSAPSRLIVQADCTVAQAQQAFGTTLKIYQGPAPGASGTVQFRANSTALKVPSTLVNYVVDVSGLETYSRPRAKNTQTLTPPLIRGLYNTLPLYNGLFRGTGRTVGISNFDGFRISDAILYINQYGLPTPLGGPASNVQIVTVDGGSGTGPAQGEGDLDLQMVLGTAPLATIIIYDGGGGLVNVLAKEVSDNKADIITESYGWNLSTQQAVACHNQHLAMTAQGITYMEATGDFGTTLEPFSYSNYEPEVFQVGGTVATVADVTGIRVTEVGWTGSGGGWVNNSAPFNTRPSWQVGPGVPTNVNRRLNPDVALHADGNGGGFSIFVGGSLIGISGTSASSPMFAGILATCEQKLQTLGKLTTFGSKQRLGRIQNFIYSQIGRVDVYHDITSGSNGTLPDGSPSVCTSKWDFVTGWGALDFNAFVNSFGSSSVITVPPSTVTTVQGNYAAGDLTAITDSDNSRYSVTSVMIDSQGNPTTGFGTAQVASLSSDFTLDLSDGSLIDLKATVEANASASNVAGQLYAFNWATNTYQVVLAFSLTSSDKTNTLTIPATSFSKFVDGSGNVRLLIRGISSVKAGRPLPGTFTLNVDKVALSPVFSSGS